MARSLFQSYINATIYICHTESHALSIYGPLGTVKGNSDSGPYVYPYACGIYLYTKCLSYCAYNSARYMLASSLWGVYFGLYNKYRMKGLGHRIYIFRNNFVYKLGYSHPVYKTLPFNIINSPKRFKKEYYFAVRGINNSIVQDAVNVTQSYRIPNCYRLNGIFPHNVIVEAKESKKGFML